MPVEYSDYLAYLLRLWQVKVEEEITWRASLERSLTGERQGFASLYELCEFLRQQTGMPSDSDADEDGIRS
jgi:hypothetical protein